ncbi:hypothetical protein BGZ46_003130 [Entomortierella lignicola]|nr:hypothetical protein BGZ46_003130 [Entomortierella lignicola]
MVTRRNTSDKRLMDFPSSQARHSTPSLNDNQDETPAPSQSIEFPAPSQIEDLPDPSQIRDLEDQESELEEFSGSQDSSKTTIHPFRPRRVEENIKYTEESNYSNQQVSQSTIDATVLSLVQDLRTITALLNDAHKRYIENQIELSQLTAFEKYVKELQQRETKAKDYLLRFFPRQDPAWNQIGELINKYLEKH